MPAMTIIAVTASICASASEAALLVASFIPISLDLGVTHRCAKRFRRSSFLLGTPRDEYSLRLSPHSANIDRPKVEQQCGGILTQPCCFRVGCRIGFCNPFDENNPNEKLKVRNGPY